MTAERREYKGAAVATTLSSGIDSSVTSFNIDASGGWPSGSVGPFLIVIDPGTSAEEKIKIASRSGTALTVAGGGRGFDGTAASNHAAGAVVKHILGATDIDLVNKHAADTTQDDHTQYVHVSAARTISAAHNFTGAPVFSGDPVFSGIAEVTGELNVTGTVDFGPVWGVAGEMSNVWFNGAYGGSASKVARIDHRHHIDKGDVITQTYRIGEYKFVSDSADYGPWFIDLFGQAVSRSTYAELFALWGTQFGSGNGTTTFNVADWRDCMISGAGLGGTRAIGATGGSDTVTLTTGNLPPHTHSVTDPGHVHGPVRSGVDVYQMMISSPNVEEHYVPADGHGDSTSNIQVLPSPLYGAFTGITIGSTGSGTPVPNVPKWRGMRVLVRAL